MSDLVAKIQYLLDLEEIRMLKYDGWRVKRMKVVWGRRAIPPNGREEAVSNVV